MSVKSRLRRLERDLGIAHDCPACQHRQGLTVLVVACELPDGTVAPDQPQPATCARCGQIPEQIMKVLIRRVEAPAGPARLSGAEPDRSARSTARS
jgi:hypothetical protein